MRNSPPPPPPFFFPLSLFLPSWFFLIDPYVSFAGCQHLPVPNSPVFESIALTSRLLPSFYEPRVSLPMSLPRRCTSAIVFLVEYKIVKCSFPPVIRPPTLIWFSGFLFTGLSREEYSFTFFSSFLRRDLPTEFSSFALDCLYDCLLLPFLSSIPCPHRPCERQKTSLSSVDFSSTPIRFFHCKSPDVHKSLRLGADIASLYGVSPDSPSLVCYRPQLTVLVCRFLCRCATTQSLRILRRNFLSELLLFSDRTASLQWSSFH